MTARWSAAGRPVLSGPHGDRTVAPRSRDTTLRALATMVGPESARARDAQFRRIHAWSTIFG